jgi:hydroxyacylglutathione hydrolase
VITQIRLGLSNVFLIKETRPILVDSGMPTEAKRIVQALQQAGVKLCDLALILHTHGHWDHCGSSQQLKQWANVPVAIHEGDAEKLRKGSNGLLKPICLTARLARPFLNRPFPGMEPDIVMKAEMDLNPFGVDGRIIPTPGHTAGSVSVLMAGGDAIVGDLIMGGYLGGRIFPRLPTYHYFAEDFALLKVSITKLLADYAPARIYVGHGGPLNAQAIKRRLGKGTGS